jgi:FkbM family methyltransferase
MEQYVDLDAFINKRIQDKYLDLGICIVPWENSAAYRWMFKEPFMDIFGPRLFGITQGNEGPYENDAVALNEDDIVVDAGANIGLFSALACSLGCEVYAFEPFEKNLKFLRQLKQLNPDFNLHICPYALSNVNGYTKLYNIEGDLGGNTIQTDIRDINIARDTRQMNATLVDSIVLDKYVDMFKIPYVSFIKADIEGSEVALLQGATDILQNWQPKLSLCSYHRVEDSETLRSLILATNPNYTIIKGEKKIYAY